MSDENEDWREQLNQVYLLLREEFDLLARSQRQPDSSISYPDPALLSQIERRAMVRSAFALIEALVFALKTTAVRRPGPSEMSPGEIALAREEDYELSEKGTVVERPARLAFLKNLRFAFHLLEKTSGIDQHFDVSGEGWQALQRATKVRDRLMHPRWPRDLEVTDGEAHDTLQAVVWFQEQHESAFLRAASALTSETQRLESETTQLRHKTEQFQREARRLRLETWKLRSNSSRGGPPNE